MSKLKIKIKSKNYSDGNTPILVYFNASYLKIPQYKSIGIDIDRRFFNKLGPQYVDKSIDKFLMKDGEANRCNKKIARTLFLLDSANDRLIEKGYKPSILDIFIEAGIEDQRIIKINFFDFSESLINSKDFSTSKTYKYSLKTIENAWSSSLCIEDIDLQSINNLIFYLKNKKNKKGKNKYTNNTINQYVDLVRRILEKASKTPHPEDEKRSIFEMKSHFFPDKLKVKPKSARILSIDEIKMIMTVKLEEELVLARDAFFLQILFQGRRISDILCLMKQEISEGKAKIIELKTQKDKKFIIVALAVGIIKKYEKENSPYVLPILKVHKTNDTEEIFRDGLQAGRNFVNSRIKKIAAILKIEEFTSHSARRTFATQADDILGGNLRIIQQMLNHSNESITRKYVETLREKTFEKETNKIIETIFEPALN